jgi:hypothetical protein
MEEERSFIDHWRWTDWNHLSDIYDGWSAMGSDGTDDEAIDQLLRKS